MDPLIVIVFIALAALYVVINDILATAILGDESEPDPVDEAPIPFLF